MFTSEELNSKVLTELKTMAKGMGLKRVDTLKKDELINKIIENQKPATSAEPIPESPAEATSAGEDKKRRTRIKSASPSDKGAPKANVEWLKKQLNPGCCGRRIDFISMHSQ